MSINIYIELFLAVIALITLIIGLLEYIKAQKWKRMEFLSNEIKEFNSNFNVKRAFLMLDWSLYKIPLAENEIANKSYFLFNDDILKSALEVNINKNSENGLIEFTEVEAIIRLIFDTLFEQLSTFQNHIDNGLIQHKDIKPYIIYYIEIIANRNNNRKDLTTKVKLRNFIENYGYDQVKRLCVGLGYNLDTIS